MKKTYTVESVTSGHPDKICDQISDAVLDAYLAKDPCSRVAVETFGSHNLLVIGGEVTSKGEIDAGEIGRKLYRDTGYSDDLHIVTNIATQSPDIAQGVDIGGAGDQGCLKKGTLVRTKRGFAPIQEVYTGDYVITPRGWRKVLHTAMTGKKKIVEIKCSNGVSLECTPDHNILCYDRRGFTYWKSAVTLEQGDFICIIKSQENYNDSYITSFVDKSVFWGKYNHKIFGPEELVFNQETAYLTGELVGDGYVKSPYLMELSFGNNNEHVVAVQKICASLMPGQWRIIKNVSSVSLKVDSLVVRKHFENLGISHVTAYQKATPRAIFTSPPEVIKSYLRGLFDSDGTIVTGTGRTGNNVRIRLCSSSLGLLRETQLLLHDFGIRSTILLNSLKGTLVGKIGTNGKRYQSNYNNYVLSLVGFESYQRFCHEIGFGDIRKQEKALKYLKSVQIKPKNSRGLYLVPHPQKDEMIDERRIGKELPFAVAMFEERIDREEEAEVYDLEVGGSHIFSGNGIFVHNSMFGYATDETPEFLPKAVALVHKLTRGLEELRRYDPECSWLGPDGKAQITMQDGNITTVLVSCQHADSIAQPEIKAILTQKLIAPVIVDLNGVEILVNPTGKFTVGGFTADTGLTGRKLMVDTYGGLIPHGGGSFSGKDPTKVDRSAAYMARFVAKNMVANGFAKECLVSVAYAIGRAEPLMVHAETENGKDLGSWVRDKFDFRPLAIIERLNLRRPIYLKTAAYGHFGKEGLPWEEIFSL